MKDRKFFSFDEWLNESMEGMEDKSLLPIKGFSNDCMRNLRTWKAIANSKVYEEDVFQMLYPYLLFFSYLHIVHKLTLEVFQGNVPPYEWAVSKFRKSKHSSDICINTCFQTDKNFDPIYLFVIIITAGDFHGKHFDKSVVAVRYDDESQDICLEAGQEIFNDEANNHIRRLLLKHYSKSDAQIFDNCLDGKYKTPEDLYHAVRGKINSDKFNI
jgi:hypothetical protein